MKNQPNVGDRIMLEGVVRGEDEKYLFVKFKGSEYNNSIHRSIAEKATILPPSEPEQVKADKNNFQFKDDGSIEAQKAKEMIGTKYPDHTWFRRQQGKLYSWSGTKSAFTPLVTPSEAIRLMGCEPEQVKLNRSTAKISQEYEGSVNDVNWYKGKLIGYTQYGEYCLRIEETAEIFVCAYIRPIAPEPLTAEQELYKLLSNPKQYKWYQKVLDWHTKHQPKPVKFPSVEEFYSKYWSRLEHGVMSRLKATYANFNLDENGNFMDLQLNKK